MKKIVPAIILICLSSTLFAQELSIFNDVQYYKDIRKITKILNDNTSELYFEKIINKYLENPGEFNSDEEKVMLLYSGIFHDGYQNHNLDSLEDRAQFYLESGSWDNAIKLSKNCLSIFPLSIKANYVLWIVYDKKEMEDSSNYYFDRMNVVFLGMMKAGSIIGDNKRPTLAYDENSIEIYLGTVVPGPPLDLDEEYSDRKGNIVRKYRDESGYITFIIPVK